MHRFTVSLLAFLGALNIPHGNGRAEPRATHLAAVEANAKKAGKTGTTAQKSPSLDASKEAPSGSSPKEPRRDAKRPGDAAGKATAGGSRNAAAWTKARPGVVKLVRGSESLEVRVLDRRQRLVPTTLPQFARFLRSKSGADHAIDGRLVTLVATVSDHFGGREVNVVSGFRPYSPGQHSRHSNHNEGRAIDFSIKGVANESVRDFCRTLRNVGVGYYPNSLFVHLDVRDGNAYWVDYAAPGQAPRYRGPDGKHDDDDESDAITSVDAGPITAGSPSDTPRSDVTHGKDTARPSDRNITSERTVFVNR